MVVAPFHFGLVSAVSRKFHGSLRAEVVDQAKKRSLSLLPVQSPLVQNEPFILDIAPQQLLGGRRVIHGMPMRIGLRHTQDLDAEVPPNLPSLIACQA